MSQPIPLRVCLAGGGSGGHVTPALALAESIQEAKADCQVHLACSQRSIDATVLTDTDLPWLALPAQGLTRSPLGLLRFARAMYRARREARRMLQEQRIHAVALLGGYVASSVLSAARQLDIPTLLLNLDAISGKANRWMAPRATAIASTVELVNQLGPPGACVQLPGPLIRLAARPTPGADKATMKQSLGLDGSRPLLLITGASQGATSINTLMAHVANTEPNLLEGWQVLHLAGPGRQGDLEGTWRSAGVPARVEAFRSHMGVAWGAADLVIARAGASTVAEARFAGVPAIYLPYPYHRDQHQHSNAAPSVDEGSARVVRDQIEPEATWPALRQTLQWVLQDGGLTLMTQAAQTYKGRHGGPQAATMLLELARRRAESAGATCS
ncbi:MAG: UDP-N-acetylglucosamine--N-acetylmuramyl-(pentapeptide) pyrophosphoryl-undecaprenol N-acetylglucosamine transferase [Phycisphaerales bacterium]|nr:UDP-N-acetylglucosamine--N-acetylmuramyl-(pentapeptide) pyrophosphoryl-undecaprenol N-acetylglucosamine transferase [Phycisphaerales bacterium]